MNKPIPPYNLQEAEAELKAAMKKHGITPPDKIAWDSSKFQRCATVSKPLKKNAAYKASSSPWPQAWFQDFSQGTKQHWTYQQKGVPLQGVQKLSSQGKKKSLADSIKEAEDQEQAALLAEVTLEDASTAELHPYAEAKGIAKLTRAHWGQSLGYRSAGDGSLLIPIYQIESGAISSYQKVFAGSNEEKPSWEKRFLPGGKKKGGFFPLGETPDPKGTICICEGAITGESIHQATGFAVAVAFDCGNLGEVTGGLRKKFPEARLIVCADDDANTLNNPGRTKAEEVAYEQGCLLALPEFGEARTKKETDFNDLHHRLGSEAVRSSIERAVKPGHPENFVLASRGNRFKVDSTDVYYLKSDGDEEIPIQICARLDVKSRVRNNENTGWGLLLSWLDSDHKQHSWAMPEEMLHADHGELRQTLANLGLDINAQKKARDYLPLYIQACKDKITSRTRTVEKLGWYDQVYVWPDQSFKASDLTQAEEVIFQSHSSFLPSFEQKGSLEEWRKAVSALARGNSRAIFALSLAFSGPLLEKLKEGSFGFHFVGPSSQGKTLLLNLAASVWGKPDKFAKTWRATTNGLEGLASLHNDNILVLDELSQIDSKEAGQAVYMLANGQGKTRATKVGLAKNPASWRLVYLSAGEQSLSDHLALINRKTNTGQEIRLAEIAADAGLGLGAFEALHNFPSSARFAENWKAACQKCYGQAGVSFLENLVGNKLEQSILQAEETRQLFKQRLQGPSPSGQVSRVLNFFSLVAAAGELATNYGITAWVKDEAFQAAAKLFKSWLESWGEDASKEESNLKAQIRQILERDGSSRFQKLDGADEEIKIHSRLGFYKLVQASDQKSSHDSWTVKEKEYWLLPEAFKEELCKGYKLKWAIAVLQKCGWLQPGNEGTRPTRKEVIPGEGRLRFYVFTPKVWEDQGLEAVKTEIAPISFSPGTSGTAETSLAAKGFSSPNTLNTLRTTGTVQNPIILDQEEEHFLEPEDYGVYAGDDYQGQERLAIQGEAESTKAQDSFRIIEEPSPLPPRDDEAESYESADYALYGEHARLEQQKEISENEQTIDGEGTENEED